MNTRRQFLFGVGAFLAAPAIVRVSSIMPIKPWLPLGVPRLLRVTIPPFPSGTYLFTVAGFTQYGEWIKEQIRSGQSSATLFREICQLSLSP